MQNGEHESKNREQKDRLEEEVYRKDKERLYDLAYEEKTTSGDYNWLWKEVAVENGEHLYIYIMEEDYKEAIEDEMKMRKQFLENRKC